MITALLLGAALLSAGCDRAQQTQNAASNPAAEATSTQPSIALTTYKSATCGCCKLWVDHANEQGFAVDAKDVDDLNGVKKRFDIAPEFQSCHTSVSDNNYVFEGHVPAKFIRQFLQNPPANARGLAVPAMPLGSPGMEVGDRFTPYDVVLLHKDGGHSVYARIENAEQQF
ncbi:DUF411 domain-containing protein [Microbulbifer elongatus]|uniref:DUF411 domain-containing protein n=1 Tax=Microbulbifer elongatus TaxID=86173 RepID=UPI001E5F2A10|nr:DUF411 domain-containing protein [Microbulbifer elongatus]